MIYNMMTTWTSRTIFKLQPRTEAVQVGMLSGTGECIETLLLAPFNDKGIIAPVVAMRTVGWGGDISD